MSFLQCFFFAAVFEQFFNTKPMFLGFLSCKQTENQLLALLPWNTPSQQPALFSYTFYMAASILSLLIFVRAVPQLCIHRCVASSSTLTAPMLTAPPLNVQEARLATTGLAGGAPGLVFPLGRNHSCPPATFHKFIYHEWDKTHQKSSCCPTELLVSRQ